MNITGIGNTQASASRIQPSDSSTQTQTPALLESSPSAGQDQAVVTRGISLSEINPRTRAALQKIVEQGGDVQKTLQRNIEILQEDFLNGLTSGAEAAGLPSDSKITLRLGADGNIVAGDSPHKETVESMLAESPDLAETFREIAAQSALVRDIRSIRSVVTAHTGLSAYAEMEGSAPSSAYQVSIKGDMSHFYFSSSK